MRTEYVTWECDYCQDFRDTGRHELPEGWLWVPDTGQGLTHACPVCAEKIPDAVPLGKAHR